MALKIVLAVDGSKQAVAAFNCKYTSYQIHVNFYLMIRLHVCTCSIHIHINIMPTIYMTVYNN